MPVEVASTHVLVPHHARMHVAGQVVFRGSAGDAEIVVEDASGSDEDLDTTREVARSEPDRYLVQLAGDTEHTLGPGVYRVRLLVQRPADVVLAHLRHVLLATLMS